LNQMWRLAGPRARDYWTCEKAINMPRPSYIRGMLE
jgi:hypothetical protein